jgi:SAM-dependent methyltransferase
MRIIVAIFVEEIIVHRFKSEHQLQSSRSGLTSAAPSSNIATLLVNSAPVSSPADHPDTLADQLRGKAYLDLRLNPPRSEIDYLINCDLRDAIVHLAQNLRGRTLDYGCGGSPYQPLLAELRPYVRADIPPGEGLDLVLDSDGLLPGEPDGSYDVVLSTQVLEHVPDAPRYLAEAHRLLRPGGVLLVSTHGLIPEHGCPYDFQRWTSDGLARAVAEAGLVVEENLKLTIDARAFLYFLNYTLICLTPQTARQGLFGWIARGLHRRFFIHVANWLGDRIPRQRFVPHGPPERLHQGSLYVGVAIRARKREAR